MDNSLVALRGPRRIDQTLEHDQPPLKRCKAMWRRTNLLLPEGSHARNPCKCSASDSPSCVMEKHLHLPASYSLPVDMHLRSIQQVAESAHHLLTSPVRHLSRESRERLLYVGQGELGHATPLQCDVIASDNATTCHILALRSTVMGNAPLVSLAHIDWTGYGDSIRGMIQEHKAHHCFCSSDEEEKKGDGIYDCELIDMDVHIVGGFEDAKKSSRNISEFLINLLVQLAEEENNVIRMTLRTCAISSMNDTGGDGPVGRGMGIDLHTGEAFLAKVDKCVAGPCHELRSARLWAGACKRLAVIHTSLSNYYYINPFSFRPSQKFKKLLRLPDHLMIQQTSTSPTVEADDFCDSVRRTLHFMLKTKCCDVFGVHCDVPLAFCRAGAANEWTLVRNDRVDSTSSYKVIG